MPLAPALDGALVDASTTKDHQSEQICEQGPCV